MEEKKEKDFRRERLQDRLKELKKQRNYKNKINKKYILMGILSIIISIIAFMFLEQISIMSSKIRPIILTVGFLYGLIFFMVPIIKNDNFSNTEIREIEDELDLLNISEKSLEERAKKQFKLHQYEIKKYYDQTRKHSSWIFLIGITCIIIGFSIIGVSFYLLKNVDGIQTKYIIGVMGSISGILTNYIGTIYLKMYSETIKSLTEFHNRLVYTHHLHFSNFIVSKIKNNDLREKTLSDLVIKLVNTINSNPNN